MSEAENFVTEKPDAVHEYGIELTDWSDLGELDAVILAVAHKDYLQDGANRIFALLKKDGVLFDVKSVFHPTAVPSGITYWSL